MKIDIVPLAGLILGVLVFDSRWEQDIENSFFEMTICLGLIGIRLRWYD